MSWACGDIYPGTSSLADNLDKKLLVILRDGRKLIGILRSFDQFERPDLPPQMINVSLAEIREAQKAEKEASELKCMMRKRMGEFLDIE
ncbi:hypothetical protein CBR_g4739 [Chara braunii]|uniref:Sm domain-containing protein n=1 Tax=Chara braunii TaxID=69332 RepID=A0A388KIP1_CHABU|nr:hypothetical protein CBR_g4739 [Chara braunii]|eukprot:GBG69912.1 hypothetical protein CBR_g4739 [Chara braunii]